MSLESQSSVAVNCFMSANPVWAFTWCKHFYVL